MIKKAKLKVLTDSWENCEVGDMLDFYLLEGEEGNGLGWFPKLNEDDSSTFVMVTRFDDYWVELHPNAFMNLTETQTNLMEVSLEMWEKSTTINVGQVENVLSLMKLFQNFNSQFSTRD